MDFNVVMKGRCFSTERWRYRRKFVVCLGLGLRFLSLPSRLGICCFRKVCDFGESLACSRDALDYGIAFGGLTRYDAFEFVQRQGLRLSVCKKDIRISVPKSLSQNFGSLVRPVRFVLFCRLPV